MIKMMNDFNTHHLTFLPFNVVETNGRFFIVPQMIFYSILSLCECVNDCTRFNDCQLSIRCECACVSFERGLLFFLLFFLFSFILAVNCFDLICLFIWCFYCRFVVFVRTFQLVWFMHFTWSPMPSLFIRFWMRSFVVIAVSPVFTNIYHVFCSVRCRWMLFSVAQIVNGDNFLRNTRFSRSIRLRCHCSKHIHTIFYFIRFAFPSLRSSRILFCFRFIVADAIYFRVRFSLFYFLFLVSELNWVEFSSGFVFFGAIGSKCASIRLCHKVANVSFYSSLVTHCPSPEYRARRANIKKKMNRKVYCRMEIVEIGTTKMVELNFPCTRNCRHDKNCIFLFFCHFNFLFSLKFAFTNASKMWTIHLNHTRNIIEIAIFGRIECRVSI